MPICAVIFDLGGVLVRTGDRAPRAALAERLGMSYEQLVALVFESQSARQATLGEITSQDHWESLRRTLELSPEAIPEVRRDFFGGDVLDNQLVDYIRALRPQYKTGLLSNAWDDLRPVLQDYWRISDAFDQLIISAEVGLAKPDPRIYRMALERFSVAPGEAVLLDDFSHNVEAARAVGMHAIHFQQPQQAQAELEVLLNSR